MRYWWVNQNQTYQAEVAGGYMWSPKRNNNGARNQFYENMRAVVPGDLVFSYRSHFRGLQKARSSRGLRRRWTARNGCGGRNSQLKDVPATGHVRWKEGLGGGRPGTRCAGVSAAGSG
jgi:hypothetical protein